LIRNYISFSYFSCPVFGYHYNKRIKILSEAEINDLYSLPKFTLEERIVFFSLNKKERQLIEKIPDISSKVHAILQLGYFKAKGRLFSFNYKNVLPD